MVIRMIQKLRSRINTGINKEIVKIKMKLENIRKKQSEIKYTRRGSKMAAEKGEVTLTSSWDELELQVKYRTINMHNHLKTN